MLQVKIVEGELYPTVSVTASVSRRHDNSVQGDTRNIGSVLGQISIPIYDGGSAYSRTRAAKESLGERRLQVDSTRDRVVQAVVAAWALMEATGFQIEGAAAQVAAAEIALNGVREEARVGQRTTLDVLNAQQELLNARVSQVTAQRDRVVASYALLSPLANSLPGPLVSRSRPMIRRCITSRSRTAGSDCARPAASKLGRLPDLRSLFVPINRQDRPDLA